MWNRWPVRLRRVLRGSRPLQIALLGLLWSIGSLVAKKTGLPISGGVLGLLLTLVLLFSRVLSPLSIRRGADWLLHLMLLFFVPATLAVLDHPELHGLMLLKVLVVLVGSTLAVMAVTGLVIELGVRRRITR
jgi:holin-like protein